MTAGSAGVRRTQRKKKSAIIVERDGFMADNPKGSTQMTPKGKSEQLVKLRGADGVIGGRLGRCPEAE